KDFGKLKAKQILGTEAELKKDEVWNDLGDPICVITKYSPNLPEYFGVFSPTITIQVTPASELDELDITEFEDVISLSEMGMVHILRDFNVLKRYPSYKISNVDFHEFDSEYLFEHVELVSPVKVELKTIKAYSNGFYYDFNFHQSLSQNQTAEKEFEKFKQSIRLL